MSTKGLLDPFVEHGIKHTHFFEGRLLTAQDLRDQQQAERSHDAQIGRALGAGVLNGLHVSVDHAGADGKPPVLKVAQGLAINADGDVIEVAEEYVKVQLARSLEETSDDALFATCGGPLRDTEELPDGVGVYLLVMLPAQTLQGRAAKSGLGDDGVVKGCGSRHQVVGVQFRLVSLSLMNYKLLTDNFDISLLGMEASTEEKIKTLSLLRNYLAYLFLEKDTSSINALPSTSQTFNTFQQLQSALEVLHNNEDVLSCEVPLALLYWDLGGVQFTDNWSVKRLARQYVSAGLKNVSPSFGVERFLQFVDHLQYLMDSALQMDMQAAEELFRYLPPVAYVPVQGAGSSQGVNASTFFDSFTRGIDTHLLTNKFYELYQESLHYASVDLNSKPYLNTFALRENRQVVNAALSQQLYQGFASNAMQGPSDRGALPNTFEFAWTVYRGLIKRRVFLPLGSNADAIAAQISIVQALRDVLEIANRQAARSGQWSLNTKDSLEAVEDLYDIQKELAQYFLTDIPGIEDIQERDVFANRLMALLDGPTGTDVASLDEMLQADDLHGAIDAQNQISNFVGTWSGEGVAVGPIYFQFHDSLDGSCLVPNGTFRHRFRLINDSDKRLNFKLEAVIDATTGDWENAVEIYNTNGNEIETIDLASTSVGIIEYRITAPRGAQPEEVATLEISAESNPPTSRTATETRSIPIKSAPCEPVTKTVEFQEIMTIPDDLNNLPLNVTRTFLFFVLYQDSESEQPDLENFTFEVTLTDATGTWAVAIDGTAPGTTKTIRLQNRVAKQIPVIVATPNENSRSATIGFSITSQDLDPAISDVLGQTFDMQTVPAVG